MHAEVLPWSMCVTSLVSIVEAVLLLDHGDTHIDIHTAPIFKGSQDVSKIFLSLSWLYRKLS